MAIQTIQTTNYQWISCIQFNTINSWQLSTEVRDISALLLLYCPDKLLCKQNYCIYYWITEFPLLLSCPRHMLAVTKHGLWWRLGCSWRAWPDGIGDYFLGRTVTIFARKSWAEILALGSEINRCLLTSAASLYWVIALSQYCFGRKHSDSWVISLTRRPPVSTS